MGVPTPSAVVAPDQCSHRRCPHPAEGDIRALNGGSDLTRRRLGAQVQAPPIVIPRSLLVIDNAGPPKLAFNRPSSSAGRSLRVSGASAKLPDRE